MKWQRWFWNVCIIVAIGLAGMYVQSIRTARGQRVEARTAKRDVELKRLQVQSDYNLCVQIEAVKQILRDDEAERYSHLHRNLRLLHVNATPELLRIARLEHNGRMERLQEQHCDQ